MKNLMTLILAGAVLTLSSPGYAWVAARGGGGCYHAGYSCGGVHTGTTYAAGAMYGTAVVRTTQPVYVAPVYSSGYYVSQPPPPVVVTAAPSPGSIIYSLPPGAQASNVNGVQYYMAKGVYYQPFFGSNGVYYQVVSGPF